MHPVNPHGLARTLTELWTAPDLQGGAALPCSERVNENRALREAPLVPRRTGGAAAPYSRKRSLITHMTTNATHTRRGAICSSESTELKPVLEEGVRFRDGGRIGGGGFGAVALAHACWADQRPISALAELRANSGREQIWRLHSYDDAPPPLPAKGSPERLGCLR
jgi:hypothetical protein